MITYSYLAISLSWVLSRTWEFCFEKSGDVLINYISIEQRVMAEDTVEDWCRLTWETNDSDLD